MIVMNEINMVIPVIGMGEAEKEFDQPLELVGPYLESVHLGLPDVFYDEMVSLLPEPPNLTTRRMEVIAHSLNVNGQVGKLGTPAYKTAIPPSEDIKEAMERALEARRLYKDEQSYQQEVEESIYWNPQTKRLIDQDIFCSLCESAIAHIKTSLDHAYQGSELPKLLSTHEIIKTDMLDDRSVVISLVPLD